jgi:DNA-binding MarR family transcriptional regulator
MITIEHIRNLGAVELRILLYVIASGKVLSITQEDLATEINVSRRSAGKSLRVLEERGAIHYKRSTIAHTKSVISLRITGDVVVDKLQE